MQAVPQFISSHLLNLIQKTGGNNGPIGRQFIANPQQENRFTIYEINDPYEEKRYEIIPGLIHKYPNRVLWLVSRNCGSYCRFCMRRRIFTNTRLAPCATENEIKNVLGFLAKNHKIREIILSGGDPLIIPQKNFEIIIEGLTKLQKEDKINTIRINTRAPVLNPLLIQEYHYELINEINNPYLFIHINHPFEMTKETDKIINNFRKKSHAIIMGQSVLLKGVNDSVETLCDLFSEMIKRGIIPYCIYQNDPVPWAKHFTVPIKEAIQIWQKVRPKLSGLAATAKFIVEPAGGIGKIPIPEAGAWDVDYSHFYDYNTKKHPLNENTNANQKS